MDCEKRPQFELKVQSHCQCNPANTSFNRAKTSQEISLESQSWNERQRIDSRGTIEELRFQKQ